MGMPNRAQGLRWVLAALTTVLGLGAVWAQDAQTLKIMPWSSQPETCLACHPKDKGTSKLAQPTQSCDVNCRRCHEDMDKHHPVGPAVEEKDKVGLPLLGRNQVSCISCHDLKTASQDRRSWKSQSLYARLFQGQTSYKTYYLRVNNSDGKLCKICH
jgi:hypothetical protein